MRRFEKIAMVGWVTVALAAMAFAAGQNLPDGEAKALVEKNCTSCHDATPIVEKKGNKEVWTETVKNMQAYGLQINDADFAKVVDYLTAHFGAGAPAAQAGGAASKADEHGLAAGDGREVVAQLCTSCHDLEGVKNKKLNAAEWGEVINNMTSYGAMVNDAEFRQMRDYLAKAYGK